MIVLSVNIQQRAFPDGFSKEETDSLIDRQRYVAMNIALAIQIQVSYYPLDV